MADIVLGEMCRRNFFIYKKYEDNLDQNYKNYVDEIESQMILGTYGSDVSKCTIVKKLDLVISEEDINRCLGEEKYIDLENAIINFCQHHNVCLSISRENLSITVTIEMLRNYRVVYM